MSNHGRTRKTQTSQLADQEGVSRPDPREAIAVKIMEMKTRARGWRGLVSVLGGELEITRATLGRYATRSNKDWAGLPPLDRIYHLAWGDACLRHGDQVTVDRAMPIAKDWLQAAQHQTESDSQIEAQLRHWSARVKTARELAGSGEPGVDAAKRFRGLPLESKCREIIHEKALEEDLDAFSMLHLSDADVERIAAFLLLQPDEATLLPSNTHAHHVVIRPLIWSQDEQVWMRRVGELITKIVVRKVKDHWLKILTRGHSLSIVIPIAQVHASQGSPEAGEADANKLKENIEERVREALKNSDDPQSGKSQNEDPFQKALSMGKLFIDAECCDDAPLLRTPYYLRVLNDPDLSLSRGWRMEEDSRILKALSTLPSKWIWSTLSVEMEQEELRTTLLYLQQRFGFEFQEGSPEPLRRKHIVGQQGRDG